MTEPMRTYHPLGASDSSTIRHPGMLTECDNPICIAALVEADAIERAAEAMFVEDHRGWTKPPLWEDALPYDQKRYCRMACAALADLKEGQQ